MAATASFAQSSVTIYGQFDAGVYSIKNFQNGRSATVFGDGATFSNVVGFRGTEDLGGGLNAGFNLETDVQTNNGGINQNGLFRRAANVSLGGSFGTVRVGTTINPIIATNSGLAPVGGNSVMTSIAATMGYADFFTRNAVTYTSPNINGLVAVAQHGFSNSADGLADGSVTAGSLAYTSGPLQLRAAAQKRNGVGAVNTSAANNSAATAPAAANLYTWPSTGNAAAAGTSLDKTSYVLGARYNLGAIELGAAYMSSKIDGMAVAAGSSANGSGKYTGYLLGVGYTTGAWTLGGNYATAEGSSLTSLQARYALSKRTNVIATAGLADNAGTLAFAPVAFNTGTGTAPITNSTLGTFANRGTDRNISGFGVGLTHSF